MQLTPVAHNGPLHETHGHAHFDLSGRAGRCLLDEQLTFHFSPRLRKSDIAEGQRLPILGRSLV